MLRTRIITALVILPVLLLALFWFPRWAWTLFTLGIVLVACHEWTGFCGFDAKHALIYRAVTAALAVGLAIAVVLPDSLRLTILTSRGLFVAAALFWLIAVPLWLYRGWVARPPWLLGVVGWVVIFPTWAAFLLFRNVGPWLLMSLMIIVFVADIGAYFAGRRFGKNKLAPSLSPNKTWEGVVGGLIAVMIYFLAWLGVQHYIGGTIWARPLLVLGSWLPLVFLFLAAISVLGDLFESWMKRCVGVKDSGTSLPGHGGVLDRIDALTAALPLAGLLIFVWPRL